MKRFRAFCQGAIYGGILGIFTVFLSSYLDQAYLRAILIILMILSFVLGMETGNNISKYYQEQENEDNSKQENEDESESDDQNQ